MNISKHQNHLNTPLSFTTDINNLSSDIKEDVSDVLNSQNTLKETVLRIYLLRHYPYIDTSEWYEYEACLKRRKELEGKEDEKENNTKIERLGNIIRIIPEFKTLPDEVKKLYETIFSSPEKTALFFDLSKEGRANLTGKDLSETFPSLGFVGHVNLPGSNKNYERGLSDADKVTEIKKAVQDVFDITQGNYETIVIIGNRSYAEGFDVLKSDRDRTHEDNEAIFEEASYFQIDYCEKSINHPLKIGGLQIEITPSNMEGIASFINRKENNDIITTSSPQKAQNQINRFFYEKPEKFKGYFENFGLPVDLRVFSLANLIRLQDYNTIERYYLSEAATISAEEKILILQNVKDPKIRTILRKLFISREDIWNGEEGELFSREGQQDSYASLKRARIAYKEAMTLQSNSLDPLIKNGEKGAVSDRKLYYEEKREPKNERDSESDNNKKDTSLVQKDFHPHMFDGGGKYTKFVVRAHVGEGKSIYLSELVKNFSLEQDIEVRFVRAKEFDDRMGDIDGLFDSPDVFVCIDAVDEAKPETREKIKGLFSGFTGRSIITTRHSEFFSPNDTTCVLYFTAIDMDVYIESRFQGDGVKAMKVKKWIKNQGLANEIKGNPLLLNLITLLANATEDEKKWMNDYYILPLDQIWTNADLYESVVRFVLAKHQMDQKGSVGSETMLEIFMERLGKYAFDIFSDTKNTKIDQKFFDANLSILFKSTESGSYDFIHKSFYEFFLAKHLTEMPKNEGNQEIYDFRDQKKLENWNDWREFRPVVLFYGEILAKEERWDELEKFLGKEVDVISNEWFFVGLEILYKLEVLYKLSGKTLCSSIKKVRGKYNKTLAKQINFWESAVSGNYRSMKLGKKEYKESEVINKWYLEEVQSRSYQAPNWKISPERALLFQQFRSDPNYHLKNLVEVVIRDLVEDMLRSDHIEASVSLTSDSDDVFAGVDLIVEMKTPNGAEYVGLDIAISDDVYYLSKKEERTETICREFNAFRRLGNKMMPRQVFAIPTYVMNKFMYSYMRRVASGDRVKSSELTTLLIESNIKIVTTLYESMGLKAIITT
ncbi:MAG: hypothetical protein PHH16_02080 [Candidatus Gracilibacteria bacterium]|nr:hypothetical protein [Candidatus Gracilibacteria bacterium]